MADFHGHEDHFAGSLDMFDLIGQMLAFTIGFGLILFLLVELFQNVVHAIQQIHSLFLVGQIGECVEESFTKSVFGLN